MIKSELLIKLEKAYLSLCDTADKKFVAILRNEMIKECGICNLKNMSKKGIINRIKTIGR